MRHSIPLLLLAVFLTAAPTAWAAPAVSQKKPATAQQQTGTQTPEAALTALEKSFDALCVDAKKGGLRDNWLQLAGKFQALVKKNSGESAAKADFFAARCHQELGQRSYMASDHRKAVELFAGMAKKYPKSPLAPAALYRQASIQGQRLKDSTKALAVLDALKKGYPNSQEAKDAPTLESSLTPKASTSSTDTASSAGTGKKPATATVMEQLGLTVKTIMIDAGHGGKDPGCSANGIVEKTFTLAMAKRIGGLLQKKGFTVLYTRSDDTFITLQDRPDLANTKNADLFISVHLNANPSTSIHGLETYYLDSAKTKDAATVAARENGVSVKEISDLQVILTDLMLTSKVKESRSMAGCVQKAILGSLRKGKFSSYDHGVRSAPFYVLVGARMPAILVEFGYATNATEAANLKSDDFLLRQAQGVVDGVAAYKDQLTP